MIYTFKSRATADLKMTGPVGDRVLALIGKGPVPKGIVEVDDLPAAIQALQAAVAAEAPRSANDDDDTSASSAGHDVVSLRQRVWPLLEMMKRSLAEKQPIVWGV